MERVIVSLLLLAGLSMVAGWASVFRNRYYLGLLGLAFLTLAGTVLAAQKAKAAREFGVAAPGAVAMVKVSVPVAAAFFLAAMIAAVQEVRRRLAEMRDSYRSAEEALLEIARASAEKERRADQDDASAAGPGRQ